MQGLIDQLQRNKLLLIETQDAAETTLALANYQKVTGQYRTYSTHYSDSYHKWEAGTLTAIQQRGLTYLLNYLAWYLHICFLLTGSSHMSRLSWYCISSRMHRCYYCLIDTSKCVFFYVKDCNALNSSIHQSIIILSAVEKVK